MPSLLHFLGPAILPEGSAKAEGAKLYCSCQNTKSSLIHVSFRSITKELLDCCDTKNPISSLLLPKRGEDPHLARALITSNEFLQAPRSPLIKNKFPLYSRFFHHLQGKSSYRRQAFSFATSWAAQQHFPEACEKGQRDQLAPSALPPRPCHPHLLASYRPNSGTAGSC